MLPAELHPNCTCAHRQAPRLLTILGLLGLSLIMSGCLNLRPTVQRGQLLRTESEIVRTENLFEVVLPPGPSACPRLQLYSSERVHWREVQYFAKVLEYKAEGERDPSKIRREIVTNDELVVRGEERVEIRHRQPMAMQRATLNGVAVTLDAEGCFLDREERLLRLFDDKSPADNHEITVTVESAPRGPQTLAITRRQLQENLGLNLDIPKNASGDNLLLTAAAKPENPQPGSTVQVTLTVINPGNLPAARVEARLFSRTAWLSGRYFYIGTIPPGQRRSFTRTLTVPPTAGQTGPRDFFAEIAVWDQNMRDKLDALPHRSVPLHLVLPETK